MLALTALPHAGPTMFPEEMKFGPDGRTNCPRWCWAVPPEVVKVP